MDIFWRKLAIYVISGRVTKMSLENLRPFFIMQSTHFFDYWFHCIMVRNQKMAFSRFRTFWLDIFLDIYFCPFSKKSVDFFPTFSEENK